MKLDSLLWVARRRDGSEIAEFDATGDHGWAEVTGDISEVFLIDTTTGDPRVMLSVPVGVQPEFFRRRAIMLTEYGTAHSSATCIGWPGAYLWIYEDGSVRLTADRE